MLSGYSQSQVTLEQFETKHGLRMLETHLRESFTKHRLPNNIYPFSPLDVQSLCLHASSARTFIQNARDAFEGWLDQKDGVAEVISAASVEIVVTQDDIDRCLEKHLTKFEEEQRRSYLTDIPIEEDFIGRMRSTFKTLLDHSPVSVSYERAQLETRVMAPNLVIQHSESGGSVCLAIMYRTGYSFAARLKNLRQLHGREFDHLVILRDQRCAPLGPKCRQYIDDLQLDDIPFIHADVGEISLLNGLYDVLVAIEEHDVAVGASSIDKGQFSQYLRAHQVLRRSQLFREASRGSAFLQHVMTTEVETDTKPQDDAAHGRLE